MATVDRSITNLIPSIHAAVDVVSRELVGFIPSVTVDADASRAAIGQTVYSPVSGAKTASDITASVTPPDSGDSDVGNVGVAITKARLATIRFTGEQTAALGSRNYETIMRDEIAQAMRTLVNEIETDLAGLYKYASRAYGTAGTAPFGSTPKLTDAIGVKGILDDNGAPTGTRSLIIGSAAEANLAALANLTQVADAGTSDFLRRGVVGDLFGLMVRKSSKVAAHTKGTATANYDTDLAESLAVGATSVHLDTGTGTWVTGDLFVPGDGHQYLVTTGDAVGGADIDVVLANPGLRASLADGVSIAAPAAYTGNLAFSSDAIKLAVRLPMQPAGGDSAEDSYVVTDPVSGLSFEVRSYGGFHQRLWTVEIAWGVKAVKPEHMAVLLG